MTAEHPGVHADNGVSLADFLSTELLAELDEQEWDSLDFSGGNARGRTPPFMIKQFHAYFIAMVGIISMHMCGARGNDQYAPFLAKAGTQPEFLRGLPRGAQIFALPTFIILMGISDLKLLSRGLSGSGLHGETKFVDVLQRLWRDLGRPLLLFFVCKFLLPAIAGWVLHPFYGLGKGGHVTFNWIFLFMVYARATSQLLVRGLRLPRWAPGVLALALHFGCFAGAEVCPSPFGRSYKLIGPLPAILNCPRFSVYYPFYALVPLVVTESRLLSRKLDKPVVRACSAVIFSACVLWAMGAFNIDTSYMVMEPWGCRGVSKAAAKTCEAAWDWGPFVEDLGSLVLCTLATVALLVACPTTQSFASAVGQRSLVALIVHLYAIYPLNPPLQIVCRWLGKHVTPIVLPALGALVLCTAVQIVCCVPIVTEKRNSSEWWWKMKLIPSVRLPAVLSLVAVGVLGVIALKKSLYM
eukprot:INCI17639.2.p1 GENE.INCI17639.2~~INCI17639.2.p1  ORF type:complete len:468 (+),score=46.05 INCI17639.2:179-1582(+)